ncbi:hypothetical protein BBP40_005966 [Aspergillus hancockii]|nr:hypothetical protein BBP40_005966 [Aspergillus hancockii]
MGLAIARRLGVGRRLLVADFSNEILCAAHETLTDDGYMVEIAQVDVSDYDSVSRFAHAAASHGPIEAVIHTAGLSPSACCAQRVLEVDLLGTANALDAFLRGGPLRNKHGLHCDYGRSYGIRLAIAARASSRDSV